MKTRVRAALWTASTILAAGQLSASVVSTFNTTNESWDSVGFSASGSYPNFSAAPIVGAVTYNSTGGNPGGYISKQDPDGNWQYFRAPAAFLGNQIGSIGAALTFDLIRLDTFPTSALSPQGPLVAVTNGSLVLVYAAAAAIPTAAWQSYNVPLTAIGGFWKVTDPTGADATVAQFNSVFSSLTGLYILGDFTNGSGTNGEIIGLDNVVLNSNVAVPEPASVGLCFLGLGLLIARVRRVR